MRVRNPLRPAVYSRFRSPPSGGESDTPPGGGGPYVLSDEGGGVTGYVVTLDGERVVYLEDV